MLDFPSIPGSSELLEWFGGEPSFHDAEILELHLDRSRTSWIRILTVGRKPAVVMFTLEGIVDLELFDFSEQNVISGLTLEPKGDNLRMTLGPCYGMAGFIEAKTVAVEVAPRG